MLSMLYIAQGHAVEIRVQSFVKITGDKHIIFVILDKIGIKKNFHTTINKLYCRQLRHQCLEYRFLNVSTCVRTV